MQVSLHSSAGDQLPRQRGTPSFYHQKANYSQDPTIIAPVEAF